MTSTALATTSQPASLALTALVPTNIAQAMDLAKMMASANLIPDHLKGKDGDCLLVIMQACRWGMDALSVAQCTSVVRGKLCYEGKLVSAVLVAMGTISGRLRYEYSGSGPQRAIRVIGRLSGETTDRTVEGTVAAWATQNDAWKRDPDMMLSYRGARQWARLHAPDAMLGIYTPDELEDAPAAATVTVLRSTEPQPYPADEFEANLPKWRAAIDGKKATAEGILAKVESKGKLTDEQRRRILALQPIEQTPAADEQQQEQAA